VSARASEKARALISDGCLRILEVNPDTGYVHARCRGDSGLTYELGRDPRNGQWRCTCKAATQFRRRCAHLIALQLVTADEGGT
jgi:uncharacterized Zn finger protein